MNPKVSVIICTYNRAQFLPQVLQGLAIQTLAPDLFEIILVDNNSKDQTAEICTDFRQKNPSINFRYVLETRQGLSFARNRGIDEAQSDILVFIDDDAIPEKEYLYHISRFFETTPDAAAAGGRIYPLFESKRPVWMPDILTSLVAAIDLGDHVCLFKKKFPIGANMIFRKSTIRKYGPFNVNLGRRGDNLEGAEEKDLFLRVTKAGEKVYYIPDAIVHHFIPDKRLTFAFFRRQALGIGYSEKVRAKNISRPTYFKSLIKEALKWIVSFLMCLYYCITLRFSMGWRLLIFRYYVTKGLFKSNINNL